MTGFELKISGVGSDRSANEPQPQPIYKSFMIYLSHLIFLLLEKFAYFADFIIQSH